MKSELISVTESPNVTECHIGEDCLSEKQLAAIELMLLGKKTRDIAEAIGVERRTIWDGKTTITSATSWISGARDCGRLRRNAWPRWFIPPSMCSRRI
jgi:hypothetical protein